VVASLPPRREVIVVSGSTYYYADGVYYAQAPSGYEVVPAPVGAVVEHPPQNVTNVYVDGREYGYDQGTYYEPQPPGDEEGAAPTYEVIAPPVGATVPSLPEGAEKRDVEGNTYFFYTETFYKPFYSGSDVVYMVAADPKAG
jgi:hypothetical protein